MNVKFTTLLICAIALLSVAKVSASDVVLTPAMEPNCEKHSYRYVNWMIKVSQEENEDELKVAFFTSYGKCINQKVTLFQLTDRADANFYHQGGNFPWKKLPFSYDLLDLGAKSFKLTLDFDKKELFKKKDSRKFTYIFVPVSGVEFKWKIKITKLSDNQSQISMTRK